MLVNFMEENHLIMYALSGESNKIVLRITSYTFSFNWSDAFFIESRTGDFSLIQSTVFPASYSLTSAR